MKSVNLLLMVISDIKTELSIKINSTQNEIYRLKDYIRSGVCDEFNGNDVTQWKREVEILEAQKDILKEFGSRLNKRTDMLDK